MWEVREHGLECVKKQQWKENKGIEGDPKFNSRLEVDGQISDPFLAGNLEVSQHSEIIRNRGRGNRVNARNL